LEPGLMEADAEVDAKGIVRAMLAVRATARVLFMWKMVAMSQVCLIFPYPQYNFLFQPGK
jgi:hypothetical protein